MSIPADAPPERPVLTDAVATITQPAPDLREVRVDFPQTSTPSLVTTTLTSQQWKSEPLAATASQPHHTTVDAVSRPEHDAKLAAVEARLDGKIVKMESLLERVVDNVGQVSAGVADLRNEVRSSRTHTTNVTVAIVVAVLGTGVALYQAMSGSNSALLSAFQAGLSISAVESAAPSAPANAVPAARELPPSPAD